MRRILLLAAALLAVLALACSGDAAASSPEKAFRCPDMHGFEWDFYMGDEIQKSGNAYLVFRVGVSCNFADHWARYLNLHTHGHVNKHVFTNPPRGFFCRQEDSEVFKEAAKHEPAAGFDVGSGHCSRFVGEGENKRVVGLSWEPLPLGLKPKA